MSLQNKTMDAKVLKRKKTTISKGKIKKTIKNVICRPDPVPWPAISEDETKQLESILNKYRVDIPEFKKPQWKDLKNIPKCERPKQPPVKKVEGLVFGLSECRSLLENKQLAALILEGAINPKTIVHPLLEACNKTQVPVICLTGLKIISKANFGISTSCLGVKFNILMDLTDKIIQISQQHKPQSHNGISHISHAIKEAKDHNNVKDIGMKNIIESKGTVVSCYPYLYRTDKKRVFVPANTEKADTIGKEFIGQDFIEFSSKTEKVKDSKAYMKMVVKRISNNPNRVKVK